MLQFPEDKRYIWCMKFQIHLMPSSPPRLFIWVHLSTSCQALREDVERQMERERELQQRYGELLMEREALVSSTLKYWDASPRHVYYATNTPIRTCSWQRLVTNNSFFSLLLMNPSVQQLRLSAFSFATYQAVFLGMLAFCISKVNKVSFQLWQKKNANCAYLKI